MRFNMFQAPMAQRKYYPISEVEETNQSPHTLKKKKDSKLKPIEVSTIMLLEEDIQRIFTILKHAMEEEHEPLVVGIEQVISSQKRIQQEYTVQFT